MFLYINDIRTGFIVLSANNFIERAFGLIFRKKLSTQEVFHIKPCNSVHSFGMKYEIDIVYLNQIGIVLKIIKNMKTRKINWCFKANSVLEFESGTKVVNDLTEGDIIVFKKY
jgi:uncharacterized protein